jgi:branched-subunit amino acid ABC-type transport system permease component
VNSLTASLSLLVVLCVCCSTLAFGVLRSFWVAQAVAVAATVLAFQAVAYLQLGFVDPFWELAAVVTAVPALFLAAFVGLAVRWVQARRAGEGKLRL